MLEKEAFIEAVAAVRKLKSNTIKEHILECVLVGDWPYYSNYIEPAHYTALHSLLEKAEVKTFSEAKAVIDDLDFFTYRLIEIERTRQNE
ncbi:MAG: helix-turn-helix domain-containing protein [Alkalibacterium sp.]|nr:helix-turn-helix domain-containing protein [Alkalibacterium sp.]